LESLIYLYLDVGGWLNWSLASVSGGGYGTTSSQCRAVARRQQKAGDEDKKEPPALLISLFLFPCKKIFLTFQIGVSSLSFFHVNDQLNFKICIL
jgi:hypothetical protein